MGCRPSLATSDVEVGRDGTLTDLAEFEDSGSRLVGSVCVLVELVGPVAIREHRCGDIEEGRCASPSEGDG